jgi:hypothetical protein
MADGAWQRIDMPLQRRKAYLEGRRVLSEPASRSARAVCKVRFALGALLLSWAAVMSVEIVLSARPRRGAAVLLCGAVSWWLVRGARKPGRPSLCPPSSHSRRWLLAEQTAREDLLRERAAAEKLALMPLLEGVHYLPEPPRARLCFDSGLSAETFARLLTWLLEQEIEFALFDAVYPGTQSDPGAHLSYRPVDGAWHMTLGNHGWTGGIYRIDPAVVCLQLADLNARGQLEELRVQDVGFFLNKELESEQRNLEMNEQLRRIHTAER